MLALALQGAGRKVAAPPASKPSSAPAVTLESLRERAASADPEVRAAAARGFASLRSSAGTVALVALLTDPDESVVAAASAELVDLNRAAPKLGARESVQNLVVDPRMKSRTRAVAADVVARIGSPSSVGTLEMALRDPSSEVRRAAARALSRMERVTDGGRGRLVDLLDDSDVDLRRQAMLTLGHLRERRACPQLLKAMGGTDASLRTSAHWALRKISGKEFPPDVSRWVAWWNLEGSRTEDGEITSDR